MTTMLTILFMLFIWFLCRINKKQAPDFESIDHTMELNIVDQ